jgi:hypothetical protein
MDTLLDWKNRISEFLKDLKIELHPEKSKVYPFHRGTNLLGYKVFYHHKLVKKNNLMTMRKRLSMFQFLYENEMISRERVIQSYEGWAAYAMHANSYNARKGIVKELNSIVG